MIESVTAYDRKIEKIKSVKLGRRTVSVGDRIAGTYWDKRFFNRYEAWNTKVEDDGAECDFRGKITSITVYDDEEPQIDLMDEQGGTILRVSEMSKIKFTDHKKHIRNVMVDAGGGREFAWGFLRLKGGKREWRLVKLDRTQDPKLKVKVEVHDDVGRRTLAVDAHTLQPYWAKPKKK